MTEFQKEISVVVALLVFSLGCFLFVGTARIETTWTGQNQNKQKIQNNENTQIKTECNFIVL